MKSWAHPLKWLAERVSEDVRAIRESDPAARTAVEVALVYPGLHALWLHRAAHALWENGAPLGARILAHANRFFTGIEIHPAARIGRRVVIDHGMGVVIGETASIGDGCVLYKGVVLGGTSLARTVRHPQVGDNVVIGTNAVILGAIRIGNGARIGSGSVVVKEVPAGATVVGVPARVIVPSQVIRRVLDHAALPDPIADMIRELADQSERLRARLSVLEARLGIALEADSGQRLFDGSELPPLDGG
jgi:serine O-acetyltransferase